MAVLMAGAKAFIKAVKCESDLHCLLSLRKLRKWTDAEIVKLEDQVQPRLDFPDPPPETQPALF